MTETVVDISGYAYGDGELNDSHHYLVPSLLTILASLPIAPGDRRVFDLGCGNGAVASVLEQKGYQVTGVEVSTQALEHARGRYPHLRLSHG